MKSIKQILLDSTNVLSKTSPSPRLDAELLLQFVINKSRSYLYTYPEKIITKLDYQQLQAYLKKRIAGKPIAYIIGSKEFWSLELEVSDQTLIPRDDTEILIEAALELVKNLAKPIIFDLGTGCGAIAIAIASERPDSKIYASDNSVKALIIAKRNIERHKIKNIKLIQSSWLDDFPAINANLIISNPPYIANNCQHVEEMVKAYEPSQALFSENNGFQDLLAIIEQSKYHLRRQGNLLLEHGINQEIILNETLIKQDYTAIKSHADLQGINRCIQATKKQSGLNKGKL